ncbi:MAG: enoyl-CoA hydratase/isomerase family protein [Myxococcales bacterium]|nr:enoyl-CoA hydratase/isomerase family protein [Myxococcales bacterium]
MTATPTAAVTYERPASPDAHAGVGIIRLQRAANRNSMTPELLDGFAVATALARADAELRALVVTGEGGFFSAGADFRSNIQRDDASRISAERSALMYEPFLSLLDLEVPTIAACNGHAVGGGFGLALACDLRIGAQDAKFGANFVKLGIHPGMAITYLLPQLIGGARAAELLFTGRLLDGRAAEAMGVLGQAVPASEVLPTALALATQIAENAPIAVRLTKRSLRGAHAAAARAAAYAESFAQAATLETSDAKEGVAALLAKRPPTFSGR